MTFWSTRAITFFRSPLWIDLSAFTDSSTSVDTVLTSASGAWPACACAPKAKSRAAMAKSQERVLVRAIMGKILAGKIGQGARTGAPLLPGGHSACRGRPGGPRHAECCLLYT